MLLGIADICHTHTHVYCCWQHCSRRSHTRKNCQKNCKYFTNI